MLQCLTVEARSRVGHRVVEVCLFRVCLYRQVERLLHARRIILGETEDIVGNDTDPGGTAPLERVDHLGLFESLGDVGQNA